MPVGNRFNGHDDTMQLDFDLDSNDQKFLQLVQNIWPATKLSDGRKTEIKKQLLKVVLLNLHKGYKTRKSVAYSCKASTYSKHDSKYRRPIERYSLVMNVVRELEKNGFIEKEPGRSYKNPNYIGQLSKIYPGNKLINLFKEIREFKIVKQPKHETVILKDNSKKKVNYDDDVNTIQMRNEIKELNNLRNKTSFSLKGIPVIILNEKSKKEGKTYREILQPYSNIFLPQDLTGKINIPLATTYLHRVFSNNSFKKGGRFYGNAEVMLPKKLRKYLAINGKTTIEIDYSSHHLNILYHQNGINFKGDLYLSKDKKRRALYKSITMTVINNEKRPSAIKALLQQHKDGIIDLNWMGEVDYKKIEKYYIKWERVHYKLKNHFYKNNGLKLMHIDSKIMNKILMHFAKKGIVACGVHDSVLIDKKYKDELRNIMTEVYKELLGYEPKIK